MYQITSLDKKCEKSESERQFTGIFLYIPVGIFVPIFTAVRRLVQIVRRFMQKRSKIGAIYQRDLLLVSRHFCARVMQMVCVSPPFSAVAEREVPSTGADGLSQR
jgi:hypothetical protein